MPQHNNYGVVVAFSLSFSHSLIPKRLIHDDAIAVT